ncbi:MAG: translation elongation factor Ts [Elusimicrobia bacterium RIFCSPLOWO2_12_FULL_59_9]|nr:MAG: translation elongation factor Ts [Elusimicrobia bacterium RIFCSPLOWO2_12_FULL_59_9]
MVTSESIAKLRAQTGAGIMDCKSALTEAKGDEAKAIEVLRKKGLADAQKRSGRQAKEGLIYSYIHPGSKVGAMIEINCETDFVARTADFKNLAKELAMQVVATSPKWIRREEVPTAVIGKEMEIYSKQAENEKKPAQVIAKIAEGRLSKYYSQFCLLEQPSIRDSSGKTKVESLIGELAGKIGENITLRRFARFELGEE